MLITLTTDFGLSDHFVGVMKGVISGIAPRARLIDITHEIEPYNLNQGAFTIAQSWRWFPKGTIHVAVIDPGVGSTRRPILVEAGGHRFIGPDNGVFSPVYDAAPAKVRVIENPKMMLAEVSRTFHGRDVFAPAAAHLARGVPPARFGKAIRDFIQIPALKPERRKANRWTGSVLKADRFGNLITNFHIDEFPQIRTHAFEILVGEEIVRRLALTFSEAGIGETVAVVGSSGYLEIAANQTSAARKLGCGSGADVDLEIF